MHIPDTALDDVRSTGFAIVEGFLAADELEAARDGLFQEFPSPETYFADPAPYAALVETPFAGIKIGPYRSWDLSRLAFHPDLVNAAERYCGSTDLQLYKIELWAKYSEAVDYDQAPHRDYGNHNLVVPRADGRWPQLTTFILLSDVTEQDGPTKILPRAVGDEVPLWPSKRNPGEFADREVSVTGPAGTILLYTTDVMHRGSAMTGHERSRFVLLTDYSERGNPWMNKVAWPDGANRPDWVSTMCKASVRERDLFGFPPPGHEYWNEQTIRDVGLRYPEMDMSSYLPG
ncbi:MAG: phytanoyl-CoA dioxygenase family protein [Acidimicrobiales bacterium]